MIGAKRQLELLAEEVYDYPEDCNEHYYFTESDELKHEQPQKRQKSTAEGLLILSHTDTDAIKQLKEIEKSNLSDDILSMKLQSLCGVLPQEAVSNFLQSVDCPKIISLIPSVLGRAN
jgi:predicted class III extradiol MEMO1 family dioxygenase